MKAAIVTEPGAVPQYGDVPDPQPKPGFEEVSLIAAGVHRIVRAMAAGTHYASPREWPAVPGVDAVARTEDGRVVYTGFATPGTMAQRFRVPFSIELPAGADPATVAATVNPALAAWMPLSARLDEISSLGTVLVLGATGASGGLAVDSALALGATRVVAMGRNEAALAALERPGVTTATLRGDVESTSASMREALDGDTPTTVLDFVWGPAAEAAFDVLGAHGTAEVDGDIVYVEIGAVGGATAAIPAATLRSRPIRLTGSGAGSFSNRSLAGALPRLLERIADGTIAVPHRDFPLDRVEEAWTYDGPERAVVTG